jgi:small-conductance mechanosensitive channel/CRP-like cAMP-binding protein
MIEFLAEIWLPLTAFVGLTAYMIASRFSGRLPRLPLALLMLYFSGRVGLTVFQSAGAADKVMKWADTGLVVILSWAVARLVFALAVEFPARARGKPLPKITRDFSLFVVFAVVGLVALRAYGNFNLAGVLTTSAVLTAVLGLGAQATLSSFFSGLVLQLEHPFAIGDWIQYGDLVGEVVACSWKSTHLRSRDGTLIFIPNSDLLSGRYVNLSKPDGCMRGHLKIGLDYDAPPNTVREVILEVLRQNPYVVASPGPEVWLTAFGDFSIEYTVYFWTRNVAREPHTAADINNAMWYALRRHGIRIPFPVRDVQLAHEERAHRARLAEAEMADLLSMLDTVSVLQPLSADERFHLLKTARLLTFGTGEDIVREGEDGDSMYVIRSGTCEILKRNADGGSQRLTALATGAFFGEMSLLTGEKRAATVRSAGDATVVEIGKREFSRILLAKPEIAATLADVLASRQQGLQQAAAMRQEPTALRSSLRNRIRVFFGLQ